MVVVVLLIMVSLLLPGAKRVKQLSYRAICSSNLKQIHILNTLYLKDNRNAFYPMGPSGSCLALLGVNGSSIRYRSNDLAIDKRPLNKYLGIPLNSQTVVKSYRCPSSRGIIFREKGADYVGNISDWSTRVSNKALGLYGCRTLNQVKSPVTCVLAEEIVSIDINWNSYGISNPRELEFWHAPGRHNYNMIGVDGSARGLMPVEYGVNAKYNVDGSLLYNYTTDL
jgi:hypothetical protein